MFKFIEVPEGLQLTLTDEAKLRQEFPNLDVNLYEAMEYCDFAPEGKKADDWSDISGSIGHAAIGHGIVELSIGELGYLENIPTCMFENPQIKPDDILKELAKHGKLLFTPFEFSYHMPTEK
ncbi:hypothetical protein [Pontibacter chinhatensis]|uniref:Uncharacterized protein n=1 Tax=Pontibacter chinhatensis TaxID=1436961 RepID=A0A1I2QMA8_9BACT|nr:hypothetical protein [Pontibacter chinhatensis]SFG29582.1 hypothetical protein SAMN05421739_10256 [Pontibacter chinhatensis]